MLISYYYSIQYLVLNNKYVVITGADSGLGLESCALLATKGIKVIALTLTEEGSNLASKRGAAYTIHCDLTIEREIKKAAEQIGQICDNKLWSVVHNAGVVKAGFIDFQPIKNYRDCMEVNFFGIVSLNQRLLPMIKAAAAAAESKLLKSSNTTETASRIVIVTSVDGIVSLPGNAPYDSSKFAAEAYADALRCEMSFWNVFVSVINPSTMRTPLALTFFESQRATYDSMEKQDPNGNWKQEWTRQWLDEHIKINSRGINSIAENPIVTVKDIYHAVTSKYPKFRYLSGTAAKTLFYLLWVLPEHYSFSFKKSIINPPPQVIKN
jgi:NAD(P)-dependent dehydrogenase (short-subunit alcohol dehydrogenase family)